MAADYLRIAAKCRGRVCVLTISGELDWPAVDGFAALVLAAADEQARFLVLDLSGLEFIDCAGARALADLIRTAAVIWPVAVHVIRAPVRRVFELTGIDIGEVTGRANGGFTRPTEELAQEGRAVRSWAQDLRAQSRQIAGLIAATEEQLAVTLTWLAELRPDEASRLVALSQAARQQAADYRRRTVDHRRMAA